MARTKGSKTTCGYCYDVGHNRRTCPTLKDYIERNPDCYTARVNKRAAEQRKASGRRCSYCAEQGHNRATCKSIKEDTATYRQLNRKFQATM